MKKEQALEKVRIVKSKRPNPQIQRVLSVIEDYIDSSEDFSYVKTMQFIENNKSVKLGGYYAQINTALDFLKNELRAEYKKSKKR